MSITSITEGDWRTGLHGPPGFVGGGSFRGVNFFVRSAKSKVGRKIVIHEFPGADEGQADDLGKRVRRYTLECYVLGANYTSQRDKLVAQFETQGPGLLIHPFWGTFIVTVESDVEIEESWDQGGMARFTLAVAQVGTLKFAFQTPDTFGAAFSAATALLNSAQSAFATAFAAAGAVQAVVQGAANAINAVATTLNSIKGQINAVMQTIDNVGDAIQSFSSSVSSLILLPSSLASQLSSTVAATINSVKGIGAAWSSYFGNGQNPSNTSNPSLAPTNGSPASADARAAFLLVVAAQMLAIQQAKTQGNDKAAQQANSNLNQINILVAASTVAAVSQTAIALPYGSANAALNMRNAIVAQIDALALQVTDDATFTALTQLRAAVNRHLVNTAANLPQVITYTPQRAVPALILAQRLYGSPDLAEDILARNDVVDPTQLYGGIALEVLSV